MKFTRRHGPTSKVREDERLGRCVPTTVREPTTTRLTIRRTLAITEKKKIKFTRADECARYERTKNWVAMSRKYAKFSIRLFGIKAALLISHRRAGTSMSLILLEK
ncbi:hypothetical protein KM043_007483 [Ampulex compressa]|nr:hypothetical protein KM043_007483 [Ampulex compressa]